MHGSMPQLGVSETPLRRTGAAGISIALFVLAAVGIRYHDVQLIELHAFLPICATLWSSAELITAFLLLSQFYVAGKLAYALLAAAYAFNGLLTLPYLFEFPGVFPIPVSNAALQISIWLWIIWHCTFPIAIAAIYLFDPTLEERTVRRSAILGTLWKICGGVVAVVTLTTVVVFANKSHLPILLDQNRHFTASYSLFVAPAVIVSNAAACVLVVFRLANPTPLQLWMGVALLTAALDGTLNSVSPTRYTLTWYIGKAEALTAASIVLIMLLYQVSSLYRRLFEIAGTDALT